MPPAPVGLSLDESARRIGSFRWLEIRCFEIFGSWVPSVAEPEVKILLARHSTHHGWHAAQLGECLPSTKDHDPDAATVAPSPGVAAALETIAAETGTLARLVAAYQVLGPERIAAYDRYLDAASAVSDAAVRRVVRIVLLDEVDHVAEGLAAIESLAAPDAAAEARERFSSLLAAAGGLRG
jgi:hypothetical protein